MLTLVASLLLLQAQPAPAIDWEYKAAPDSPAAAEAPAPPAKPARQTEEERIAAANAAALARAEQARREAQGGDWSDRGGVKCRATETGFVCANSEKELDDPDSPARQMLDSLLKPD
ncbi:MAG TPA: hypothetical protein VEA44_07230 [Caulobacter sp.]|nr:hypothetical protein [Caulobacter sp.]